jgi:serine/threonine protein kinase
LAQTDTPNNVSDRICKSCKKTFAENIEVCPDCSGKVEAFDPLIGTVFAEKYEVQSVLGRGGMSIVYKARHKYMNRVVALKLLLEHLADDPTAFQRFQKEAQAASSLSHQNIVSVHDFGVSTGGQAYFVMDCLEGEPLDDVINATGGVPLDRAVSIFRQACEGLAHAHKKGVVHRDLKPSNIVLVKEEDGSETVKIVDFGLAKLHRPEGVEEARLTQSGMVFGSPLYMSPEQCQGYPLDARSDIYSFGVLMYETLAGTLPFKSDSFFNIALLHIHKDPPPFSETAPSKLVPKELEAVIVKCMAKDADKRYESVDELRQKILDSALISGVPGLKAGAVVVSDSDKHSPFRKTFENMKTVIVARSASEKKKTSIPRALMYSLGAVVVIGSLTSFFFFPGAEGDRGTPYQKLRWQLDLELASKAVAAGDLAHAEGFLADAKSFAIQFADRRSRERMTLERQSEVFTAEGKFREAEKANQDIADILTGQILAEAEDVSSQFRLLGVGTDSEAQKQTDRMHAIADTNRLVTAAKRVNSRNLYRQEESLLKVGKDALERLQLGDTAQMGDLDAVLADCLIAQQRLDEVREVLVDAKEAREHSLSDGSKQSKRKYIKSLLQLGQFDRDQSNFAEATKELEEALAITQRDFPEDKAMMAECLNSYADLLRQTGKPEKAAALVIQAKALHAAEK